MSPLQSADHVRHIAAICYRDCDEAVGIIAFLQAGDTRQAETAFGTSQRHIPILLRKAMMQRLLMSIMRMHDRPGSDRETLHKAFGLLEDPAVYLCVLKSGDEARLGAAVYRWARLLQDPALITLRNVRNFDIAHAIPSQADKPRPLLMEFFRVAEATVKLAEDLAAGCGVCSVSLDAANDVWAKRAAEYWTRLLTRPSC